MSKNLFGIMTGIVLLFSVPSIAFAEDDMNTATEISEINNEDKSNNLTDEKFANYILEELDKLIDSSDFEYGDMTSTGVEATYKNSVEMSISMSVENSVYSISVYPVATFSDDADMDYFSFLSFLVQACDEDLSSYDAYVVVTQATENAGTSYDKDDISYKWDSGLFTVYDENGKIVDEQKVNTTIEEYAAEYDISTIASVQEALNNAGYDCGTPDGVAGSQTQGAIEQYQADHGLNVNGIIDDELLSSLGILDNDPNESIATVGVPVSTFVERYNDSISYYNGVALPSDLDYANSITEDLVLSENPLSPDDSLDIALNHESEKEEDYISGFTAWGDDTEILVIAELDALVYALDTSLEDPSEAMYVCNDALDALEMEYNGISYSIISGFGYIVFNAKNNNYVSVEDNVIAEDSKAGEIFEVARLDAQYQKSFSEGLAGVKIDDKWGFINTEGELVIETKYEDVNSFSEGLAAVQIDDKWGYINTEGELVIEAKYENARSFSDECARVKYNGSIMYIDADGKVIFGTEWDSYDFKFSEGLLAVQKDDKWGFINKEGELVIDLQFDDTKWFSNGLAPIKIDDKWGYVNTSGEIVIEPQWERANSFQDNGMACVAMDGKCGFIDSTGDVIIEPQFDEIYRDFSEGLLDVSVNDKWGYIDETGEWVIKPQYDSAYPFNYGLGLVEDYDGKKLINSQGDVIFGPDNYLCTPSRGLITCADGIINTEGNIIIPINNVEMVGTSEGLMMVRQNGKLIIYDVSSLPLKNENEMSTE